MSAGGFFVVFLLVAIGAPVLLWLLIESETDDPDVMDRRSAEEAARADSRTATDRRESTGREQRARQDTDDGCQWHSHRE
ncbi:hypothetical protein SAMN05216388_100291 [Halorientalis persicus]|uniref:Uncharacterized protein n=1 Tax=Halorientalis persicus TaxID=1367881 RepID=A0A1H8ETN7_9EURY|nr:hypothetical protein [Halorientalis persicus]SEN22247.1 hypothetical protein SAMN05216388_100291 [Halorientalis persicus]